MVFISLKFFSSSRAPLQLYHLRSTYLMDLITSYLPHFK
nr:MAG TPA: hypothetical protein [Caudoviricetes sp.]